MLPFLNFACQRLPICNCTGPNLSIKGLTFVKITVVPERKTSLDSVRRANSESKGDIHSDY